MFPEIWDRQDFGAQWERGPDCSIYSIGVEVEDLGGWGGDFQLSNGAAIKDINRL